MPMITVFTPAYNRAHTLPRTYESLKRQDCKDFIWLIVDDGSTDDTAELVNSWIREENEFEIRYEYKPNGGMHTAHNCAYEVIDTELNVCIDSDDELADGAISFIERIWNLRKKEHIAGIVGLDADLNSGEVIGTRFQEEFVETTLGEFYSSGGKGDKKLVYRTDIMKKLPPYPVFGNEKYVYLSYKYGLCDKEYKLIPVNRILCNVEYQADGSSKNMLRQYRRNPNGFMFLRRRNLEGQGISLWAFKESVHYVSSCVLAKKTKEIFKPAHKILTLCAIPFGYAFSVYIILKTRD